MSTTDPLLQSYKIKGHLIKNRMVMPPMECRLNTIDGSPTREMIEYYEARAKGGFGMIIVENTFVDNLESRSSLSSSGFYSDHQIAAKAQLAEAIKAHGSLPIIQLSHGGRQCQEAATGLECVAPSPIPCKVTQRMPRELTIQEIERIQEAFVQAAVRSKNAGFSGVEIHGAHGYLLCSFLSPYTNHRNDQYGGNFENRCRMPREIIEKVRARVGNDFIVGYRISVDEYLGEKGLEPKETVQFIENVQDLLDYVHCSAGNYETGPLCQTSSTYEPQGKIIHLATAMKQKVNIPVIAVGSLTPTLARNALNNGDADFVAFGRQAIVDPDMPNKIAENKEDDIRPCCRGNENCMAGFAYGTPLRCELNPAAAQEARFTLGKTQTPKRVVIVGGGCAGMEAARVSAKLGHDVILLEKADRLGGHMEEAGLPPFKDRVRDVLAWLKHQVNKAKIDVRLNIDATPQYINSLDPDIVILSVGGSYITPSFIPTEFTVSAVDMLRHPEKAGRKVVVLGGGLVGAETAMTIKEQDQTRQVTIIEMANELGAGMDGNAHMAMMHRIEQDGIAVRLQHKVTKVEQGKVSCEYNGSEVIFDADTIVIALGMKANTSEVEKLSQLDKTVYNIGDSVRSRGFLHCFHEAWNAVYAFSK